MEKQFSIRTGELNIPCILTYPDHGEVQRIILGIHGLGGSSNDAIQVGIAEEMDMFSAVTMRFDLPGHGSNSLPLTLRNCEDSVIAAAEYLRILYPDVEDLCIFATGFGAYLTLHCLDQLLNLPGKIKLVIQTPSVRMHQTLMSMVEMMGKPLLPQDSIIFPTTPPLVITYDFYEELSHNIVLASYPIPMLILHGDDDKYIHSEDIRNFRRINEDAKLVIIPGASHQFTESGAWDMVLDLTRDWFEFEQVLLTDWE